MLVHFSDTDAVGALGAVALTAAAGREGQGLVRLRFIREETTRQKLNK